MMVTGNSPSNQLRRLSNSNQDLNCFDRFPVTDQLLESSFKALTLNGPQWLRVPDSVSGQAPTDPSGSPHPTVGMLPSWSYPMAEIYPNNNHDLFGKHQQFHGFGGNYLSPFNNSRHRAVGGVDTYGSVHNRHRPIDLPQVALRYLRGNIVNLAKNQRGCRLLQANLDGPSEEEIDWVLAEVLYHVEEIMCDQFGNYVFQKLVKVANERQRTQIASVLSSTPFQLIAICRNPHGTRAVQKFLENINTQYQISLVIYALCVGVVVLSTDPNGHHVMQHCLKRFPFEDNEYLIYEMTVNCFEISTNKSGCCVMQTCVDFSRGKSRKDLIFEIITNAVHLAEDPYGNYVVQHLLDLKTHEVTEELLRQLEGYHVALSCNKYASNVVQKCMEETEDEHSSRVIMECLTSHHMSRLLNDPYGNYVVQTALKRFKGPILKNLLNLIRQNAASMRNNMYGKKILDLVQEMKLWRV